MDIKNSLEVLEAVKILAVSAKKIAKDGVDLKDLPEAIELIKHVDEIVAAVNGANEIPAEIKDVDQAELIALGSKVYEIVKAIKEA